MVYLRKNVISCDMASNEGTLSALEKMRKEVVVAYLEVVYRSLHERAEEVPREMSGMLIAAPAEIRNTNLSIHASSINHFGRLVRFI
jgi:hypothetical protein